MIKLKLKGGRYSLFFLDITNERDGIYIDLKEKNFKGYFVAKIIWFNTIPYREVDEFTVLGYYVNESNEKEYQKSLRIILKEPIFLTKKYNPYYAINGEWKDWDLH